ncbi:MAG: molecular chaperone DnaJ, partial [Chromatiales bacterium]|nr:molecular chaperone DnaJ [Chromatiales bacterium]
MPVSYLFIIVVLGAIVVWAMRGTGSILGQHPWIMVAMVAGATLLATAAPRAVIAAVAAAGVGFILRRLAAGAGNGPHQGSSPQSGAGDSNVNTDYLQAHLDHATGTMDARVVKGRWRDRTFASLDLGQLLDLLTELQANDPSGAQVLEAYLDREHDNWRAHAEPPGSVHSEDESQMNEQRARQILDVGPHATHEEIVTAHRRLISRVHPDRGGSSYLAAQINSAKAC